jgi:plastocyanin
LSSGNQKLSVSPKNGATPLFRFRNLLPIFLLLLITVSVSASLTQLPPKDVHSVPSASITIIDYAFRPSLENVSTGTNIIWTYASNGTDIHTVTSKNLTQTGSPVFASTNPNPLRRGQTYNFTFYSPGRYAYYCAVHPTLMTGWVNVTGAPVNPPGQFTSSVAGLALPIGAAAAIVVTIASVFVYRRRRKPQRPPSG